MLFFRLFRKVDPNCAYCRHGTRISERDVVCLKHGVVPVEYHCRAFRYDPLKRTPPRPAVLRLGGFGEADFSLYDAVPGQETLFAGMDAADAADAAAQDTAEQTELPEAAPALIGRLGETAAMTDEALDTPEGLEDGASVVPEGLKDGTDDVPPEEEGAGEAALPEPAMSPVSPEMTESQTERAPVKVKVRAVKRRR